MILDEINNGNGVRLEVSVTGWSLIQRSPIECDVSQVCDHETSKNEEA
jgi:hypothetical protein